LQDFDTTAQIHQHEAIFIHNSFVCMLSLSWNGWLRVESSAALADHNQDKKELE
jgi:hypothetical protein